MNAIPNTLTFDEYSAGAEKTAIYPEAGTGSVMELAYLGLGLGEAGEVQGKIKKIIRDAGGVITEEVLKAIRKELGDVLWYLDRLAEATGTTLGVIALENLDKLHARKERGLLQGNGDDRGEV